mmetsp:Transcript_2355/g.4197  ORF Transcript_2355/g.4197 Transcript_2355/m.4197 type:complete len:286 (-) Transcript_2355:142-999(-)
MDVIVNVCRQIVIYHLRHVRNVQSSRGHVRRHQDGASSRLEIPQGILTFSLGLVTVDGTRRKPTLAQHVLHIIAIPLRLHKDEDQPLLHRHQKPHEMLELVVLFDKLNRLGHILTGRSHASHRQENVISHKIPCQPLNVRGKGSAEHHRLSTVPVGHALLLDNAANLGFESHVKHTISLVQNEEFAILHAETAAFNEIHKPSRGGDEEIAPAFNLTQLIANVRPTVHHNGGNARTIQEFLCLLLDLTGEFAGGREDETFGIRPAAANAPLGLRAAVAQHGDDDGK